MTHCTDCPPSPPSPESGREQRLISISQSRRRIVARHASGSAAQGTAGRDHHRRALSLSGGDGSPGLGAYHRIRRALSNRAQLRRLGNPACHREIGAPAHRNTDNESTIQNNSHTPFVASEVRIRSLTMTIRAFKGIPPELATNLATLETEVPVAPKNGSELKHFPAAVKRPSTGFPVYTHSAP